jgi:hypothetical protein
VLASRCDHLFDVLKAYSCMNTTLGYCQGMAPVVGGLMSVLFNDGLLAAEDNRTSTLNELAFWLLAIILDGHGCVSIVLVVTLARPHTRTHTHTQAPLSLTIRHTSCACAIAECRDTTSPAWRV